MKLIRLNNQVVLPACRLERRDVIRTEDGERVITNIIVCSGPSPHLELVLVSLDQFDDAIAIRTQRPHWRKCWTMHVDWQDQIAVVGQYADEVELTAPA